MKFAALALVTALTVTGFTAVKGYSTFTNTSSSPETILVKSSSIDGNVVDQRLNTPVDSIVSLEKNVLKLKLDSSRVIYLDEEVTAQSSQRIANQIKQLNEKSAAPIYLLIDSPGGSVLDGATVISDMEASKAPVNTVCTRLCASMAAMIHSYGAKRYMTDRAILMYHPAAGGSQGQINNMVSQLQTLSRYIDKMAANVVARSKLTRAEYDRLTAYELWVDAEDSVQKGFTDSIVNLNVPGMESRPEQSPPAPDAPDPDHQHGSKPEKVKPFDFQYTCPYPHLWK